MFQHKYVFFIMLLVVDCINEVWCIECTETCPTVMADGWFSALMVCNIKPRNATLMWTQDENTANASYIVLYEDGIGNQLRSAVIPGDEQTYVISDLTPETEYGVQVCQPELGVCGNCEVTFSTPAAQEPSGPPADLMILASGPSTLTVSWSAPLLYPEVVLNYIVRCAPEGDNSNYLEDTNSNTRFTAQFDNLIPNTTYICEVHTTSNFGNSTPVIVSANTLPRETVPGVMFVVSQNIIQYAQLSESSLANFFSFFESGNVRDALDANQLSHTIMGVDYHFHRNKLFLTLSNDTILQYNYSLSEEGVNIIISVDPSPTLLYSADQGSTVGDIAVDWLFHNIYWIENEGLVTRIMRMDLDGGEAVCEAAWENRKVEKLKVDPIHGYIYWSINEGDGLFRGSLNDFQTSTCPVDTLQEEVVFSNAKVIDFVLEPDVFIYFITENTVHYIGFDKQNNGSFNVLNVMLVESFGETAVTISGIAATVCDVPAGPCPGSIVVHNRGNIDDILVLRKSKQPLATPPSFPADVRVFSGPESATISWTRPSFVQSFFGPSAFSDWLYCVNYTTVAAVDMQSNCTHDLEIHLSSLDNDTVYRFIVSAIGPGGERATPNEFLFRTKPAGSETARLLISTDAAVMVSDLDGLNLMDISEKDDISRSTKESNGVAYDIRSSLYFWIIEGGQGPLYRYNTSNDSSHALEPGLDTPISLAADWVGRRLFWVQDGINVADDRRLFSINMDGGNSDVFDEDPRITSIAIDSLNGKIFWITGKDIRTRMLNGLRESVCISVESEPLALTLDVEGRYLYWMTFNNEDNTVWVNQLNYTIEECGTRPYSLSLPGSLFEPSSRGVLTYGLGTLYLTTISSSSQPVYILPADFASLDLIVDDDSVKLAFGVIPQADVVRDICVVSELLQPLPDGLIAPGLSNIQVAAPSFAPRLRQSESSTSVIVIEWGESDSSITQPILYEVDYTLTPFQQPTMDTVKEFTTNTFLRLEDQTFFTEVMVTVTPHTLWLESDESSSVTSTFSSTPMVPGKVNNVRAYVYRPLFEDETSITALIVWDALNEVDAGGIINHYNVRISGPINLELKTMDNESYLIVREFKDIPIKNILNYPLENDMDYTVQVYAINDGGSGIESDSITFSTEDVSPPQEILVVTDGGSFLCGSNEIGRTYIAVHPLSVNTISRLMYWYNSTLNAVMVQSLDGNAVSVFLEDSPIYISTMAFEWQGERLYMAGFNSTTNHFELWRVPVVYSKDIEQVHQLPGPVVSVTNLVVDSFRQGRAYWLQENNDGSISLELLSLGGGSVQQETLDFSDMDVSALTLEPFSGDLWVSNKTSGIFRCSSNQTCTWVVNTDTTISRAISQDENMIYWSNGSVITSVDVDFPTNAQNVWTIGEDDEILSIHTLSPGQQPQYYQCQEFTTCLSPDLEIFRPVRLPMITATSVTNTSIEVWWSIPLLIDCCAATVFSYPLMMYNFALQRSSNRFYPQDPFQRHLKRSSGIIPFEPYTVFISMNNTYTLSTFGTFEWFENRTKEGVPDPVDYFSVVPSGVTCINVSWSGPTRIYGPPDNRAYFLTYRGESIDRTMDVGTDTFVTLDNLTPDVLYRFEVKVSNGVLNSSIVAEDNVVSVLSAPAPGVEQVTNTSMSVTLELKDAHSSISSVFIEANTTENDGINQTVSEQFVDGVMILNFNISSLSAYTYYTVRAVATYTSYHCNTNQHRGKPKMVWTEPGVPDTPELQIDGGTASWNAVNPRTENPRVSYDLEIIGPEGEIAQTLDVDSRLSEDLTNLDLEVGQSYNVCITAMNNIGRSAQSCVSYVHNPPPDRQSGLSDSAYAAIASGVFILLLTVCVGVAVYLIFKRRRKKSLARLAYAYGPDLELSNIRAQRYHRTTAGLNANSMWSRETFVATEEELANLNQFPRQYITLENFLGQGEFGEVYQGTAFDILGVDTGPHPVAIKTFRKGATMDEKHKFLSEAALMGKFDHANIVKILGICVDNDPVFIIMELMPAGDLLKFLREARPESGPALLTREEQLYITKDVAQGCRYLEQQHFIHRDLAARNCLVSSKGADRIVKIGDFGLARDLYSSDYYRVEGERKLPVRWMAPEALLQGKFTIESDVWAYGVLLYEIMSFGNQPYPGQSNQDVLQYVTAGGRLPKPDKCPQRIYRLMMKCWRKYASERPRFEEICQYLDNIIEDMKRESYCESDSDDGETLSREGSKRFPTRSPSFKSGFQNLVRSGSKKLRNSLRRHSLHRKEEQTTHTSENGDSFRESGLI